MARVGGTRQGGRCPGTVLGLPAEAQATEESWPLLPVPAGSGERYPGSSELLSSNLPPVPPIGQI